MDQTSGGFAADGAGLLAVDPVLPEGPCIHSGSWIEKIPGLPLNPEGDFLGL
jgi:hypothetical protein